MQVEILERRLHRERDARRQAEGLLERKSLELYEAHRALKEAYEQLEQRVLERTEELSVTNGQLRCEIEDRERAQLEMAQAKEAAESASRAKSEFLANMSHELRTPLNAIIGFSDVLAEEIYGALNDNQRQYVSDILDGGQHLLLLVNDILDLAKIEAGSVELELGQVNARSFIERSVHMFHERAVRHGLRISHAVDPQVETLYIDERRLKQLLYNLLSNAVKFTPEGGAIEVRVALQNDADVSITVADTGVGIPPEEQARIFDTFYQVDSTLTKTKQGTGLGLALVREIAQLHGGQVLVESTPGLGSQFTIILPRYRHQRVAVSATAPVMPASCNA